MIRMLTEKMPGGSLVGKQFWTLLYLLFAGNLTSFVVPTLRSHFGTSIKISHSVSQSVIPSDERRQPAAVTAAEANKATAGREDQGREDGRRTDSERALKRACLRATRSADVCRIAPEEQPAAARYSLHGLF